MLFNKTAEEMFKELGYGCITTSYVIIYTNYKTLDCITFFLQKEKVEFQHYLKNDEIEFKRSCNLLTSAELKAVAVQLHALGWI